MKKKINIYNSGLNYYTQKKINFNFIIIIIIIWIVLTILFYIIQLN